ncbi:DUF5777 family beta-barrel protein [Carboxylicivirga caseinilyticus]|uniref:DUF5777 family beta-barrel protein n=1 Tax=Carboxylicivirga caseinilyticus TaxID=3417572 RepID=UPI003D3396CF|nr:hypothetical protein [Marinilabiliaceae bacterium A049]
MKYRLLLIGMFSIVLTVASNAQEKNLLDELSTHAKASSEQYVSAFKSTRLVLGPTTVQLSAKELQFRVSHLFGLMSDGIQELFGLDQIYNVDIALDYGLTNWLSAGIARSSDYDKTLQTGVQLAILKQTTSAQWFSLSYAGGVNIRTRKYEIERPFIERLEYEHLVLLSRKFNHQFSAQVTPGWVNLNRVPTTAHPHSLWYTALGVSYALTPSTTLNGEYTYVWPTFNDGLYDGGKNGLSVGVDIETGGHVFQLFVTNATRLQPSGFAAQWNNNVFFDGDIHFGFSIMRSFSL